MIAHTTQYYHFYRKGGVRERLSQILNVTPNEFTNDYWGCWTEYVDTKVRNDSFTKMWWEIEGWKGKYGDAYRRNATKQYGTKAIELFETVDKFMEELDEEYIVIWYCW
jgi:hypothetical protein